MQDRQSSSLLCQVEKQKTELMKELEELRDALEEQGGATSAQVRLNSRSMKDRESSTDTSDFDLSPPLL